MTIYYLVYAYIFHESKVALVLIREPWKKGKQGSPVRTNRLNFLAVL